MEGIVFLGNGFNAEGVVDLFGAQIGGSLVCNGGMFSWLLLDTAVVKGLFSWVAVRSALNTRLDLANASVGAIADDEPSWPGKGNLSLDGFSYARISGGPTDVNKRLEWLDREKDFRPQPYRQLAEFSAIRAMRKARKKHCLKWNTENGQGIGDGSFASWAEFLRIPLATASIPKTRFGVLAASPRSVGYCIGVPAESERWRRLSKTRTVNFTRVGIRPPTTLHSMR